MLRTARNYSNQRYTRREGSRGKYASSLQMQREKEAVGQQRGSMIMMRESGKIKEIKEAIDQYF